MTDQSVNLFSNQARSEWVRLRTLTSLRWMAIIGQLLAVLVAHFYVGLKLELMLIGMTIGASVLLNLFTSLRLPQTRRLTELQTTLMLIFDLIQLVCLLYLTGGLSNPFSLLILAPVTISATALTLTATVVLGLLSIISITLLTQVHLQLTLITGEVLSIPDLFQLGNWFALTIGILFLAGYARRVTVETFSMSQALAATQMALDREHKLTVLDGVVAAAAHEMGTPLATIKLVSSELADELGEDPELKEDAELISSQADRLSQILRDMGRIGKEDTLMRSAPLSAVVETAAEPHLDRGIKISFFMNGEPMAMFAGSIPIIHRTPEIIHGLRNLIQNAVDFAQTDVSVDLNWSDQQVQVLVSDDGKGFPVDMIGRIGDPFLARAEGKKRNRMERPEYQGMGLGLFIAKTLLERAKANLSFSNANQLKSKDNPMGGAMVTVSWARSDIESQNRDLDPNKPVSL